MGKGDPLSRKPGKKNQNDITELKFTLEAEKKSALENHSCRRKIDKFHQNEEKDTKN